MIKIAVIGTPYEESRLGGMISIILHFDSHFILSIVITLGRPKIYIIFENLNKNLASCPLEYIKITPPQKTTMIAT